MISSSVVQWVIVIFCLLMSLFCNSTEDNIWPYYRTGFMFAFSFDFLMSVFSTFIWGSYKSFQSSYGATLGALMIIWLLC